MRIAKASLAAVVSVIAVSSLAEAPRHDNDICLPSHLYMLSNSRTDVFFQPFAKRWRPYDDFVRIELSRGGGALQRQLGHVATVRDPVDGAKLTARLVEGGGFTTVKSVSSVLRVGERGSGKAPVIAQIVGDSYTHGKFYKGALFDSGDVPDLRLVGLLKDGSGHFNEGRGGWTLEHYFTVPRDAIFSYHGFMQPDGGRYWGATAFWKTAWTVCRGTQKKGFQPTYSCGRYDDRVTRFDEGTGRLLDPHEGDVQFEDGHFIRFDGKEWRRIDGRALKWSFDYGKYLEMWGIEKPQFLFVLLGLNDFRDRIDADFSQWGSRIKKMKESYLKACPGGRFVICIPCSTCGSIDNAAGDFTPCQNAAMWRFRDWLIKSFDNREDEGYYLLDVGIGIDNDHGYPLEGGSVAVPADGAAGTEKLRVQGHTPHPRLDYPVMGRPLAAFIQYWRDR